MSSNLVHAILHLFPSATAGVDFRLRDDGAGPYIFEWNLANPQPNEAALAQAETDYLAAKAAEQAAIDALRETIKTTAQSAVGVTLDNLTQAQIKSLVAILLLQAGAVADDLTIRPLGQWIK